MSLLAEHNLPFSAAILIVLLLAIVQAFGLGGFSIDAEAGPELDADLETESAGALDGLLSIIGIGRIPFTMWLAMVLFLFAGIEVGIQSLAEGLLGAPLHRLLASICAAVPALVLAGLFARPIARIMPKDETTAVSIDLLVGSRARILNGRAKSGFPARAQVKDRFGQPHLVMVEPHDAAAEMHEGDEILLVRREGGTFFCVAVQDRRLSPAE